MWKIFKKLKDKTDPVKYCCIYKEFGCAHVDGSLCNFSSCNERIKQELWNLGQELDIPIKDRI